MGGLALLLILILTDVLMVQSESFRPLRRSKRRWVLTTFVLEEGDNGPFPKLAGRLFNDREINTTIKYLISGPGVDLFPEPGLFSVDDKTGEVYVHRTIDREMTPMFTVHFDAESRATGQIVDNSLIFNVEVKDKNDNAPKFEQNEINITIRQVFDFQNPVYKMLAIDPDKEDTPNSEVVYSIVTQSPASADVKFTIEPTNGVIHGKGCLDYEKQRNLQIIIQATDRGTPTLSSTATLNIVVRDGNNYLPIIIDKKYEGKIHEGEKSTDFARICVEDKDIPKTPGWRAVYTITSGNENGNYNITTDPETNEGILHIIKPLVYEGVLDKKLVISVENEEPLHKCENGKTRRVESRVLSTVPININLFNVNDPPYFNPGKQTITESEGLKAGTKLGQVNATDPDLVSTKIRYKVAYDPEGWVTVDENTGVITTVKPLDRESPYVNNSVYSILLHAIDDGVPPQTGTGTVLIRIADINDNTPHLLSPYMEVCEQKKSPSLIIQAADKDENPFADPFTFEMVDETKKMKDTWKYVRINDTSVELTPLKNIPKGNHTVALRIFDRQGESSMEHLVIRICSCPDGNTCEKMEPAAHFLGAGGIAVMIAALLLFLLALLLLTCIVCESSHKQSGLPPFDDGNQTLIKYNEEGGSVWSQASPAVFPSTVRLGNEPDVYFKNPNVVGASAISGIKGEDKHDAWTAPASVGQSSALGSRPATNEKWGGWTSVEHSSSASMNEKLPAWTLAGMSSARQKGHTLESGTYAKKIPKQNLHMDVFIEQIGELVNKRLHGLRNLEDDLVRDMLHIYAQEGEMERFESVDSLQFTDDVERDFLDHLGPRFTALGEICQQ